MRIAVAGFVVIDEVVSRLGRRVSPGGVPTYTGLTVASLGCEALAVSNVGPDGLWVLERLRSLGVNTDLVRVVEGSRTTRFRIERLDDERRMWVPARCVDIGVEQLEVDADALYLGPVAREIGREHIARAAERFEAVMLDPQGLMRELGPDGAVRLRPIDLDEIRGVDVLRLSEEEYRVLGFGDAREAALKLSEALGCDVVASSQSRGVWVCGGGRLLRARAEAERVVDTVGAGDVVGGAYLVGLLETGEREYALALAVSAVVHRIRVEGPARLENAMVRENVERLLEKIERHSV